MANDLIPSGMPSQRDIQEMARLRAIMDGSSVPAVRDPIQAQYSGGYAGTQQPLRESHVAAPAYYAGGSAGREEVEAMKNILQKLQTLGGEEDAAPRQPTARAPITEATAYLPPSTGRGPYSVLSIMEESKGKDVTRYSVVDSSRSDVVSGLVIKEAAMTVMKLLNKGETFEGKKVKEVLDLEEEYNRNRIETAKHRQRYQRAMELGESSAAQVFKNRFDTAKATAFAAQDQIKSILESIR